MIKHQGGCHCGRVRFEVLAPEVIAVSQCNCSICSKSGHLGLIVPRDRFILKSGEESLAEYTFNTGIAKHLFCKSCGIKSFYVPRSHPDGVSVNAVLKKSVAPQGWISSLGYLCVQQSPRLQDEASTRRAQWCVMRLLGAPRK